MSENEITDSCIGSCSVLLFLLLVPQEIIEFKEIKEYFTPLLDAVLEFNHIILESVEDLLGFNKFHHYYQSLCSRTIKIRKLSSPEKFENHLIGAMLQLDVLLEMNYLSLQLYNLLVTFYLDFHQYAHSQDIISQIHLYDGFLWKKLQLINIVKRNVNLFENNQS